MKESKKLLRRLPVDILFDLIGGFIFAVGLNCFTNPNQIAPGGVSGVAVILNHLFDLPLGAVIFAINVPLLLLAWRFLGRHFTLYTLKTLAIQSIVVDEIAVLLPTYHGDLILAALFGGVCIGFGIALIFLRGATTGGTDIVSRLIQLRWPFVPIGRAMLAVDAIVVIASMLIFRNIEVGLYALINIFVSSRVIDAVMGGVNTGRMVLVVSEQHTLIAKEIMEKMGRGVTLLDASGAYSGAGRKVVLCAVRNNEYPHLKQLVRDADPCAFFIASSVNEVLGEGFASLNEKNLS